MGMTITGNTNKKATAKMLNTLSSYLFEQEYGELRYATPAQISSLRTAVETLNKIAYNKKQLTPKIHYYETKRRRFQGRSQDYHIILLNHYT